MVRLAASGGDELVGDCEEERGVGVEEGVDQRRLREVEAERAQADGRGGVLFALGLVTVVVLVLTGVGVNVLVALVALVIGKRDGEREKGGVIGNKDKMVQ